MPKGEMQKVRMAKSLGVSYASKKKLVEFIRG